MHFFSNVNLLVGYTNTSIMRLSSFLLPGESTANHDRVVIVSFFHSLTLHAIDIPLPGWPAVSLTRLGAPFGSGGLGAARRFLAGSEPAAV